MNELYFAKDTIISVNTSHQKGKHVTYGFCLETENLIKVKTKDLIPVPKGVLKITASEKVRYLIVKHYEEFISKMGTYLGCVERTAHRIHNRYDYPYYENEEHEKEKEKKKTKK